MRRRGTCVKKAEVKTERHSGVVSAAVGHAAEEKEKAAIAAEDAKHRAADEKQRGVKKAEVKTEAKPAHEEKKADEKLSVKSAEKLLDAAPKNFKDAVAAVKLPPWDANKPPAAKKEEQPEQKHPNQMFILPEHPAAAKKEEQADEKLSVKSAEKLLDAAPKNFKDAVAAVKLPPWDANKPIAKTVDTPKKANPFLEPKTHKETKEDHLRTLAAHLSSEKAALKQHAAEKEAKAAEEKQAKKEALPGSAFAAGDEKDEAKKAAEAKLEAKAKQEAAIAAFYKKQAEKV